jgi:hypothetical protein
MAATITLLTTASDWNNYGVQCIDYGDLNGALSHLRMARAVAAVADGHKEAETTTTTSTPNITFRDSDTTFTQEPLPPLQSTTDTCKNEENEDQDSRPFKRTIMKTEATIPKALSSYWHSTRHHSPVRVLSSSDEVEDEDTLFTEGIIMAPGTSRSDDFSISSKLTRFSSIQNQSISSAIITFNIGLVYHLGGREGFGSLIHLQTAVSMYQDCRDLLSVSCAFCSTGNATLDLLAMALFYNMAHIHHNDLMDFPLAKNYSEQLVRFASCIVTSRYQSQHQVKLIEQCMGDFLCNAMTIRNANIQAAAVA